MTRKIVFDTSSLVSAAIRPLSVPDRAFTLAIAEYQICTSVEHLAELEKVLRRKRFDTYVNLDSRLSLLAIFRANAVMYAVAKSSELYGCCRDKSDEYLLALAVSAQIDILVSSDRDLRDLHPWRGIPVLTPAQFLEQFSI